MDQMQRLIARWTEHGIAVPSGVSPADISAFESNADGVLPNDLRHYFAKVNGMGERGTVDDDFFSFWQLSDVESLAQYVPDRAHCVQNASRYIIVADHSIGLPSFAVKLPDKSDDLAPVASIFTDGGAIELEHRFDSFTDFLRSYLDNPIETSATLPRCA